MTRDEFRQQKAGELAKRGMVGATPTEGARLREGQWMGEQEAAVRDALKAGKPVPAEVLKDYPDLAKPPSPQIPLKRKAEEESKLSEKPPTAEVPLSDKVEKPTEA